MSSTRRLTAATLFAATAFSFAPRTAGAATITVSSCAGSAVQSAINSAAAGDTVAVPGGSCTWSTPVTISNKRLKLQGAGVDVTNITDATSGNSGVLNVSGASATNFVDIGGFTFIKQTTHTDGIVQISGAGGNAGTAGVGFRFHHNRINDNRVAGGRGLSVFNLYGLIDHVTFDVFDTTSTDQSVAITGSSISNDGGYTPWKEGLQFGTQNAVYIENSTFNYSNQNDTAIDCYTGCRMVIRYNTFNNTSTGNHGTDSGGNRSAFSVEQYGNTFVNNGATSLRAFTTRGGAGLFFNNSFSGTKSWSGVTPMVYRATITGPYSWAYCNGTQWDIASSSPSAQGSRQNTTYNTVARFLSTAPDTICATTGGSCTRPFDGPGLRGYPCRDQPGMTTNQVLAPLYTWGDTGVGPIGPYDAGCSQCSGFPISTWLAPNRDYYNFTSSFNGSVGVGRGTLAARPSSCTPLTAYFATDVGAQGTLYQCAAPNTWTAYYTPYTYPHPLQSGGAPAVVPTAPTSLRITGN